MEQKKPCFRCLLAEAGEADLAAIVAERVALIPEEDKADDALYGERLEICGKCSSLVSGTCVKCGCYAELRAARKASSCPDVPGKW